MFFLALDVVDDHGAFLHAIGEGSISVAPTIKVWEPLPMLPDPSRAFLFDDLHKVAQRNLRVHLDAYMEMVRHRIEPIYMAALLLTNPIDEGIQITLMLLADGGCRVLRPPNDVIC